MALKRNPARSDMTGAPGLAFETWETTNQDSVPHPCAFFLAQGRETSNLNEPCSSAATHDPSGLKFSSLRWATQRAEPRSQFKQRFVLAMRSGQLQTACRAGDGDYRHARQAEWRGVAQQTWACLGVIGAGSEARE